MPLTRPSCAFPVLPGALARATLVIAFPLFSAANPTVHDATAAKLKEQFHFAPAPPANPEKTAPGSDENSPAVVLERLTVVQSFERRQLERSIEHEERRVKADHFNWKDGGAIREFRHGRLQLGLWPASSGSGLNFLKFRW